MPEAHKLNNMGYLGQGKGVHFDFDNSINLNHPNWRTQPNYTATYLTKEDADLIRQIIPIATWYQNLITLSSINYPIEKIIFFLQKIHIYQLGLAFYQLCFSHEERGALSSVDEKALLTLYNPDQTNMIIRMLDQDASKRPTIEEVESVFPYFLQR